MTPTAAALALLIVAPIAARTAPTPARVAAAATSDKKVCRTMEPDTGSHFPGKRVCHTKGEWTELDTAHETGARALADHASRINNATIN